MSHFIFILLMLSAILKLGLNLLGFTHCPMHFGDEQIFEPYAFRVGKYPIQKVKIGKTKNHQRKVPFLKATYFMISIYILLLSF